MASTHMAFGFVSSYFLAVLFATQIAAYSYPVVMPITAVFALVGLFGGLFPDVDQLEFWGPMRLRKYFVHKKTFHFLLGYFIATVLLLVLAVFESQYAVWLLGLACASLGAGVHSAMDPFDGFRDLDQNQGIYEHVFLRRWIRSLNVVRFAHMWEWVIQAFATIWFIAISANLSQLIVPGWQIATGTYFVIWFVSAIFDVHIRAKGRQAKELAISTISH
jgi:hypothetical protein